MSQHRRLPANLTCFRIGDPEGEFPIFSAEGARQIQGRWHQPGDDVIYTSEHYATAMLEALVHWNGVLPPNQHFIEITVPKNTSYEILNPDLVPEWRRSDGDAARRFGHTWIKEERSAVLLVPSAVAPIERNVILNTQHPDCQNIQPGLEIPVYWDERLFR